MARRKGGGRPAWAGEDGDLFLITDGVRPVWDTQVDEVYPDAEQARRAWQSVRRLTWEHPDRQEVWPPEGAVVYDGLASRAERIGPDVAPSAMAAAAADDLGRLDRWRRAHPAEAREIAVELDRYAAALHRLAELAAAGRLARGRDWLAIISRKVSRGA